MEAEDQKLIAGSVVAGRYTIEKILGTGGMGSVYLVSDSFLNGDKVAMKVLHSELVADERQTQRFLREVQLMRRVDNAHVVRTFDVGTHDDIVYFTMEYVAGRALESFIEQQTFPLNRVPLLITQVASGLEAIHRAGIIHRDLKPANILVLDNFQTKIADFGVARPEFSELTAHNEIIGSALYIAPEVWLGTKLTPSVDLYSFGVVLYELLTGVLPFDGDSPAALMRMHLEFKPAPPKELNPEIPVWLNKLILQLLAKTEEDRPRDAAELIDYVEMQTGGAKTRGRQEDDFIKSLELEASKFSDAGKTSEVGGSQISAKTKGGRTRAQEIVATLICSFIGVLISSVLLWGVAALRRELFPDLSLLIRDLALMDFGTLREPKAGFLGLLAFEVALTTTLPFSLLGAASGSLKNTLRMILLGGVWGTIITLGAILIGAVTELPVNGSILIESPTGFSCVLATLKVAFSALLFDPEIWSVREVVFEQGTLFYPEAQAIWTPFLLLKLPTVFIITTLTAYFGKFRWWWGFLLGVFIIFFQSQLTGQNVTGLFDHPRPVLTAAMLLSLVLVIVIGRMKKR